MSATATTSADAVAAGICPRQSFAAIAFLGDDSTQKNRYGCILKLEGAWRAASRICSRSTCGISTGSKALTARLWKSASRISLMGTSMLLLQHRSVANATCKRKCRRYDWVYTAVLRKRFEARSRFLGNLIFAAPEFGNVVSGVFTPVLAKHSKSFSLIDCISVGVNRMQRNFEPMRKQVEAWQRSKLTDVTVKVVIYEAFVEGRLEAPKRLARSVHDLYFEPLRLAMRNGCNAACTVTRSLPPAWPASRSF